MSNFEPTIACFLCNWCTYAAADHAGSNRKTYHSGIRIIRTPCSGRVEPDMVMKAFREGADGVLVCGCHPGDCHYVEGNYKTERRMRLLGRMLEQFGIEPERFRLEWVSAAEADRFIELVNEMTEAVRKVGPMELTSEAVLASEKGGAK